MGDGIKQKKRKKETHMDTENSMVIAKEEGIYKKIEEGKREISGDGWRPNLG